MLLQGLTHESGTMTICTNTLRVLREYLAKSLMLTAYTVIRQQSLEQSGQRPVSS